MRHVVAVLLALGAWMAFAFAATIPVLVSDNVAYVRTVPDSASISGDFSPSFPRYYASTLAGLRAYDISDPLEPTLLGALTIPHFENESMNVFARPQPDGTVREFALIGNDLFAIDPANPLRSAMQFPFSFISGEVLVVDVTDPEEMYVTNRVNTPTASHTVACVNPACTHAYTSGWLNEFTVLDLADPDHPVAVANLQSPATKPGPPTVEPDPSGGGLEAGQGHQWEFDGAGIAWHVGTGGAVAFDVTDPANPVALNGTTTEGTAGPWNNFILHNAERPNATAFNADPDREDATPEFPSGPPSVENGNVLLVTEEDYDDPTCTAGAGTAGDGPGEGAFETWYVPSLNPADYTNPDLVPDVGTIRPLDLFNSSVLDTELTTPVASMCSSHYFNYHPSGIVAGSWYVNGMRLMDVRDPMNISQYGYLFTGQTLMWDAEWVPVYTAEGQRTDELTNVLYVNDDTLGIHVLDVTLPCDDAEDPALPDLGLPGQDAEGECGEAPASGDDVVEVPAGDPSDEDPSASEDPTPADDASDDPSPGESPMSEPSPTEGPTEEGSTAEPRQPATVRRGAGASRVQTATTLSLRSHPGGADTVILARADDYPDALAGAPLAAMEQAPVLLTGPDELHPDVAEEINRLGAVRALVLGGVGAISDAVIDQLPDDVTEVERLHGPSRWATAATIAERLGGGHVYLTEGADTDPARGWPDALAVSAVAAAEGSPVLLTDTDTLPPETIDALRAVDAVTIVGGTSAVSAAVAEQVAELVNRVDRVAGATRYQTALALLDRARAAGLRERQIVAATGSGFADALVGGPFAAARGGLLVLVDGRDLAGSPEPLAFLRDSADTVETVWLLGGEAALSARAEQQITEAVSR